MKSINAFEWKMLVRGKTPLIALLLMTAVGLYAIFYGYNFTNVQQVTITRVDTALQNRIQKQVANLALDTLTKENKAKLNSAGSPFSGTLAVRPMAFKQPSALQGLTLGVSDNQPFYHNISFYNAVYNSKQAELRNPGKLLAGNFDLAFVFIYLFPLLLIALCYDIKSRDLEQGTASILLAQGASLRGIIGRRLASRMGLLIILMLALSIIGLIVNRVDAATGLQWILVSLCYLLFWSGLIYYIIAVTKSGSITALKLVSIWVLLLIMIPSVFNAFQPSQHDAKTEMAYATREYGEEVWEMDKKRITDTILQLNPQWATIFNQHRDSNELKSIGYTYLTKAKIDETGKKIDAAALKQQQKLETFSFLNPASATQMLYNKLAGTELNQFVDFRDSLATFQGQLQSQLAVKRLAKEKLKSADYNQLYSFSQPSLSLSLRDWMIALVPLLAFSLLFLLLGNNRLAGINSIKN